MRKKTVSSRLTAIIRTKSGQILALLYLFKNQKRTMKDSSHPNPGIRDTNAAADAEMMSHLNSMTTPVILHAKYIIPALRMLSMKK